MPKELLPIVDKPLIQYVDEAIAGGSTRSFLLPDGISVRLKLRCNTESAILVQRQEAQADMVRNIIPAAWRASLCIRQNS